MMEFPARQTRSNTVSAPARVSAPSPSPGPEREPSARGAAGVLSRAGSLLHDRRSNGANRGAGAIAIPSLRDGLAIGSASSGSGPGRLPPVARNRLAGNPPIAAPAHEAPAPLAPAALPAAVAPAPEAPLAAVAPAPAAPAALVVTSATVHDATGAPNIRRKIGVSEPVIFKVGGAAVDWTATSGLPKKGWTPKPDFYWTAPEAPGQQTITAVDPATGARGAVQMDVILPTGIVMTKVAEKEGEDSLEMHTSLAFPPADVSFGGSEWLEDGGPATNITGYFLEYERHNDMTHRPNAEPTPVLTAFDIAATGHLPRPWTEGGFDWVIPNRIRGLGSRDQGIVFTHTTQAFRINAARMLTISKAGAQVTKL
jgi:hypothetical protein